MLTLQEIKKERENNCKKKKIWSLNGYENVTRGFKRTTIDYMAVVNIHSVDSVFSLSRFVDSQQLYTSFTVD